MDMQCSVCGGEHFVAARYKMDGVYAPALECARCHALNLDEAAARSVEDLDSVRMAVAARAASVLDAASRIEDAAPSSR
jgi:hypothetical protein